MQVSRSTTPISTEPPRVARAFPTLPRIARAAAAWRVWLVSALAGVGAGLAVALVNPLFLLGGVGGGLIAAWALSEVRRALFLLLVVIALLPRFALPVRLGFTPTFLDLALLGVILAWGVHRARPQSRLMLQWHPITLPLLLLVLVAIVTFVIGLPNGALTPLVLRRFAELLLSLLSIPVFIAIFRDPALFAFAARSLVLLGALSALVGIALYFIPDDLAIRLLSALRPFGYPSGPDVLRFIRDDPTLMQRATGLWIDPNAFGGWLLVAGAFALPQALCRQGVLSRPLAWAALSAILVALLLTVSRAAMLGFVVVALVVGVLRYRRALALIAFAALLMFSLPQAQALIAHFADGFAGRDLATQMRFGEYEDALRLIARYPIFGVGFVGTPDVDLYIGVSSMYLLIGQQMGAAGLAMFLALMLTVLISSAQTYWRIRHDDRQVSVLLGAQSAVVGILFSGIFDHYFFNIDFHNAVIVFCLVIALAATRTRDPEQVSNAAPVRRAAMS